jgi:hypothetical protein
MRLTVACPDEMRADANNLAMVLAAGPADAQTYGELKWQDGDKNLYACASFEARMEWIIGASSQLIRPEWDTENIIDMAGAQRAQQAIVLWMGPGDDQENPISTPTATPDKLTVVAGDDALASLSAMGIQIV